MNSNVTILLRALRRVDSHALGATALRVLDGGALRAAGRDMLASLPVAHVIRELQIGVLVDRDIVLIHGELVVFTATTVERRFGRGLGLDAFVLEPRAREEGPAAELAVGAVPALEGELAILLDRPLWDVRPIKAAFLEVCTLIVDLRGAGVGLSRLPVEGGGCLVGSQAQCDE